MDELKHYGVARKSGRYPWGSGADPYQRAISFKGHIEALRKSGMSDTEIAKYEGIKTQQLRARIAIANTEARVGKRNMAIELKAKGYSDTEVGKRMGINESSVRSLLNPVLAERAGITKATANMLKEAVNSKTFIDIGVGVENNLGITRTRLMNAVAELEEQGYKIHTIRVPQAGIPGQFTVMKAIGSPESEWRDLVNDPSLMKSATASSDDFGRTFNTDLGLGPIKAVDTKRVAVRFAEEGGSDKDGVIELRRGVDDLNLGNSKYAQVRIMVDGGGESRFLKGMAVYSDDLPDGVDVLFNTNKSKDVGKLKAMKKLEDDPDNPFGSTIKKQSGALNIVNEEGDWNEWSKSISSQVLSKQTVPLAKSQLDLALKMKQEEFAEISAITNPIVKQKLLTAFSDDCDSSAVHLKAAALPRQASKVILPIPQLKENEVYAPSFRNGEAVVLIRHPHGGTFEIPQLIVNNNSKAAKAIMNQAIDAIGINPKVAQKLSGADFDGDTVIVIPNGHGRVVTQASLKGLKDFDPIERYRIPEGSSIPPIKPKTKQTQMGLVSNLITDMTIKGATLDEIAKAVRHSMVVIDSEKHNLDYRQSAIDNSIAALSARYQNSKRGGASTLVSRASSEITVLDRKARRVADGGPIDLTTGEKKYTPTNESYVNAKGQTVYKKVKTTRMAETTDAFTLSSGRQIEEVYASYANNLKGLANKARLEVIKTKPIPYNPSANKAYAKEVSTLVAQLNVALMNKPAERDAQRLAKSIIDRKVEANPNMDKDDLKKVRNQALAEARVRAGAKKHLVEINDREWEAIQAGAISSSRLSQILANSDLDRVKQLATPRTKVAMSSTKVSLAKAKLASGYTQSEVAESLGVSVSALTNALKE